MNPSSVRNLWDMLPFAYSTEYFPLTLTLSLREREQRLSQWCLADGRWANSGTGVIHRRRTILPLPKGEGRVGLPSVAHPSIRSANSQQTRSKTPRAAAFTLVELLTVIAIIAVLASLVMTAVASAKKKSRTAVCMVNLHQISLALDMYLDDFGKRPPSVDDLVSGKYLPAPRGLLCPEDKTGNWGRLVGSIQSGNLTISLPPLSGAPAALDEPVKYSYLLHPLSWDDATWDRLMQAGGSAGVAACQLRGLGFWTTEALPIGTLTSGTFAPSFGTPGSVPDLYPLQIYLDDPTRWFQSNP